jgi:predicted HD superfamily hydrolase involved in NAD metabolism
MIAEIENRLRHSLPSGLFEHVVATARAAAHLAEKCGTDPVAVTVAALLHDCCRHLPDDRLLNLAEEFCIVVNDVERDKPVLLHGAVGAEVARTEFRVSDGRVLDAIRYHTTGRSGMSPVEQVVYLADKLGPEKGGVPLRLEGADDLGAALLACVNQSLRRCIRDGLPIHPRSVEMRNWLLGARAGRERQGGRSLPQEG